MKRVLVTGGAGFIGHHLVNALKEYDVTIIDNLSTGKREFIPENVRFIKGNLTDRKFVLSNIKDFDIIFHLAANADVKRGSIDTTVDVEQNILATHNVLEAMRINGVKNIVFTSTSTIYGSALMPTLENYGPLKPESMYGASKLACEALISAYCHNFGMRAWIFRFANVIGPDGTHGIIFDFINKLRKDSFELEVLGDGKQAKSYVYIDDVVSAILLSVEKSNDTVNIYNIGSDNTIPVSEIASMVIKEMKLKAKIRYTGGSIGWKGDIPKMLLSNAKLKALGWTPKYNSKESVKLTIRSLI
ncbi:MAG: NAD-dependent epimerase/dehydratase family protein [Nanoarchaeota archaeon]|nr:NAD-dependent epimerase/dehydratase family protein [Nanoarchaeota archaeon]MBU4300808.1 NAD-dependent epimerase/dehydratase family protein [Nanoarchaeota archaeon]MBU4451483.1 NAD-dependent epimerase/dehydratase family protein [Nanoarchaeota archaeon]MCG2723866.1 NAD-dependent epimerase/dehydratase family protein [archaeon]